MNLSKLVSTFCAFLFTATSCSVDEVMYENDSTLLNDSVDVTFNFSGIDISEKPMSKRTINDPKLFYYIKVVSTGSYNEGSFSDDRKVGYVGLFSDLKYARLRLKRNYDYTILATAMKECETKIDVDSLSKVYRINYTEKEEINIYQKFSDYLEESGSMGHFLTGSTKNPTFEDKSIDRYYNKKEPINVKSNETINIGLKRFSYKLTLEVDPPIEGSLKISCEHPKFSYTINTNDQHFSKSTIYSLGKYLLLEAGKNLSLTLTKLDNNGKSISSTTHDISVKPNVETVVKVNTDLIDSNNGFDLTLDTTPMGKEEYEWK